MAGMNPAQNTTAHAEQAAREAAAQHPLAVRARRDWNAELHAQYMVVLDERDGLGLLLEDAQKRARHLQDVVTHYENALREVGRRPADPNQTASGRLFEVEQLSRHAIATTPKEST